MNTISKNTTELNNLFSKEQQILFERASVLGGYKNLTDFILNIVQQKAEEIIKNNDLIIASDKDAEIFIDAINTVQEPSPTLKKAFADYNSLLTNKK